jgi:hypothetical protein
MMSTRKMTPKLATEWQVSTYDVWGNARDGYEVNDVYRHGTIEIEIPIELNNADIPAHRFFSAHPTDKQIREALNIKSRVRLEIDGDDCYITVNSASTGYPLGELRLVSHASLSPIRLV